jgi:hypothetical protein
MLIAMSSWVFSNVAQDRLSAALENVASLFPNAFNLPLSPPCPLPWFPSSPVAIGLGRYPCDMELPSPSKPLDMPQM